MRIEWTVDHATGACTLTAEFDADDVHALPTQSVRDDFLEAVTGEDGFRALQAAALAARRLTNG